ncbi:ricin-type beta-trefoil lectin protein [Streptomyces sp. TLI_55]|uniref:RICIN domain-containing protein n=1 Tax=Streptomyces sp. TLI_55 TaxID=1938861 RepID=UPI000BD32C6F|nr:RICIN domain-containing protein [Streptomyces sp. TLI_55]SNX88349.1 ricin-type beta-trefoil lectin protein [Streptomyces sp. TLI_55]
MTTPSPSDGPRPPGPPSPAPDEEPLPPPADDSGDDNPARTGGETPLVRLAAEPSAAGGGSFAADFARRHYFSGARLLKPGRRVAIALAGVTGLAVVGTGVVAGIARLGGDDTAQAAATVQATDEAAGTATPSPSASSAHPSHRPSSKPKGHSSAKKDGSSSQDAGSGLPAAPAVPGTGSGGGSGGGGGGGGADQGSGAGSGTTGSGTQSTPKPPKTTTTSSGFTGKFLFNFASSRCLATQGGSRAAGTQTVLADCNSKDPSQGWTFPSDGTVRDFGGTMCLDVTNPGNGALVRLANCSSSRAANQRLLLKGSYDLVLNVNPDLCVDAKDKGTAAGTVLQLWTCAGTANQKWRTA